MKNGRKLIRISQRIRDYNEEILRLYPNQEENAYWFTENWSKDSFVIQSD